MALNNAPTITVFYECPNQHVKGIPFSVKIRAFPKEWECVTCFERASYVGLAGDLSQTRLVDPNRVFSNGYLEEEVEEVEDDDLVRTSDKDFTQSHWEALMSRRSIDELEVLLEARLAVARRELGIGL